MKLSSYREKSRYQRKFVPEKTNMGTFASGKGPHTFAQIYGFSSLKRYSRTSACISSSRSILQIRLRALL